jgi:NADP-reducing hydrogenase subunit HndA
MPTGSTCQGTGGCEMPPRTKLPEALTRELEEFVDGLPTKQGHLITVLHKAQGLYGYLPMEVQQTVADLMDVSLSRVYGVVSFYAYFTMVPKGRHPISVCNGTACHVTGSEKLLHALKEQLGIGVGETTRDGKFSIDQLRCVGACALAPVLMVGEKIYGTVSPDEIRGILAEHE